MSDDLREKVARVLANAMGEIGDDVWKFYLREADAAIALIRNETLEEAAKVADEEANRYWDNGHPFRDGTALHIAAVIRGLKKASDDQ
jgi:hypothetical protein